MMFANAKNIQANLFGVFNPIDQVPQSIRSITREAGRIICECRGETLNADLHLLIVCHFNKIPRQQFKNQTGGGFRSAKPR
jgi:hypothetical protein